jgi:ABC-type branched-subunit amino acid transport system substrate-binding protein
MGIKRRDILQATTAASLTGLAGCSSDDGDAAGQTRTDTRYPSAGNYPVPPNEVVFGVNVPKSGAYASEGEAQLRGFRLARDHLNSGGGVVDLWSDLSGDGVLGRTVVLAEGDTATDPEHAERQAASLI